MSNRVRSSDQKAWSVVTIVGLVVLVVVIGLQLFPRLNDGQDVGLSEAEVGAALEENLPHVLGLLQALPLEEVNTELPELVAFVADGTGLSEDEVGAALNENFPRLAQSIAALPLVVAGWADVPDTPGTRFDGSDIATVPDVRDYFKDDAIPAVAAQRSNFDKLESTWPPTNFFPPLLTVVDLLVIAYGAFMLWLTMKSSPTGGRFGYRHGLGSVTGYAPGTITPAS